MEKNNALKNFLLSCIPAALAFIIIFVMLGNYAKQEQLNTVANDTGTLKAQMLTANTQIATLQTGAAATDSKVTQLQKDVTTNAGDIKTASGKIDTATTAITTLSGQVSQLQSASSANTGNINLQILALQNQLKQDEATIKAHGEANTALETKLKAVEDAIKKLQTTPTTGTSGTFTGSGLVTIAIVGNYFTGTAGMQFSPISPGGTGSQSFTFQVNNKTGANLNSIQLVLALLSTDQNSLSSIPFPTNTTVTISSVMATGGGFVWTQQNTGRADMLGFTSGATNTGLFTSFNNFTQAPGITPYTLTINITNNGTIATNNIFVLPQIQVTNYTTAN